MAKVIASTATTTASLSVGFSKNLSINEACFMAKATEVYPKPKSKYIHTADDVESLAVKREAISMDDFLTNMKGSTKRHVESILAQLGEARSIIEVKEGLERDAADEIAALSQALQEEQEMRGVVEEKMDVFLESHNLNIATLIKERDHARALVKVLKIEKAEFDVGHARLLDDL